MSLGERVDSLVEAYRDELQSGTRELERMNHDPQTDPAEIEIGEERLHRLLGGLDRLENAIIDVITKYDF